MNKNIPEVDPSTSGLWSGGWKLILWCSADQTIWSLRLISRGRCCPSHDIGINKGGAILFMLPLGQIFYRKKRVRYQYQPLHNKEGHCCTHSPCNSGTNRITIEEGKRRQRKWKRLKPTRANGQAFTQCQKICACINMRFSYHWDRNLSHYNGKLWDWDWIEVVIIQLWKHEIS